MRRIIRTKQSGQALGSLLCLMGFAALLVVFWKAWPATTASSNILSELWSHILAEEVNIDSMVAMKLTYLAIMGTIFLSLGFAVLGFSRQIFYVSTGSIVLQCPYCKNQWKARRQMGWAECPFCRKLVNPQVMKTQK
jgi:predicted ABC-type sugar transport system permease subunit